MADFRHADAVTLKEARRPQRRDLDSLTDFSQVALPRGDMWIEASKGVLQAFMIKWSSIMSGMYAMILISWVATLPPHTGVSGPFGPGTPLESENLKEHAAETQKSPKRVRKSDLRLFRTLLRFRDALAPRPRKLYLGIGSETRLRLVFADQDCTLSMSIIGTLGERWLHLNCAALDQKALWPSNGLGSWRFGHSLDQDRSLLAHVQTASDVATP